MERHLTKRLIQVRHVKNMTKNGKIPSFSILMAVGDGNGGLGIGIASDRRMAFAIQKATHDAQKNLEWYPRYEDRTFYHDVFTKFKASKLHIRAAPLGFGRRTHWAIQEMCKCMGIHDLACKVYGSTHPMNVCYGFVQALRMMKTPEQVAADSGLRLVDVLKVFKYGTNEYIQKQPNKY